MREKTLGGEDEHLQKRGVVRKNTEFRTVVPNSSGQCGRAKQAEYRAAGTGEHRADWRTQATSKAAANSSHAKSRPRVLKRTRKTGFSCIILKFFIFSG